MVIFVLWVIIFNSQAILKFQNAETRPCEMRNVCAKESENKNSSSIKEPSASLRNGLSESSFMDLSRLAWNHLIFQLMIQCQLIVKFMMFELSFLSEIDCVVLRAGYQVDGSNLSPDTGELYSWWQVTTCISIFLQKPDIKASYETP